MSKITLRIVLLIIIGLMMLSVSPLIDAKYQYKFSQYILNYNANSEFNLLYDKATIQFDKNWLYGNFGVIGLSLILLLYAQENLRDLKSKTNHPAQGLLFRAFFLRFIAILVFVGAVLVSSVVFEDFFKKYSSSNWFVGAIILFVMNLFLWVPYIACLGIYKGINKITVLKFSALMTGVMLVCFILGVKHYFAASISAIIGASTIGKKYGQEFKNMSVFFGIEGKTIDEMFSSTTAAYYPNPPKNVVKVEETANISDKDIKFYLPQIKFKSLPYLLGIIAVIFGFFAYNFGRLGGSDFLIPFIIFFSVFLCCLYVMVNIIRSKKSKILLQIGADIFTCLDTDYLEKNQFNVISALFIRPSYKEYQFKDIRKFEIMDTEMGSILVVYPYNEKRRGIVFYFDATTTPDYILNLLQSRISKNETLLP